MTIAQLWIRSLFYFARANLAVALGVAVATAVLTGALLVGDSVRGSLRDLTLERLGKIDQLLILDRFFRRELAEEIVAHSGTFSSDFSAASAAVVIPSATVERSGGSSAARAAGVTVLGVEASFAKMGEGGPSKPPEAGEIVVNAALAAELSVQVGDEMIIRLAKAAQVPADSPLGRKTERLSSLAELKVVEILPDSGLARFSLSPMQTAPRNAFVNREDLAGALEVPGSANTVFVAGKYLETPASKEAAERLRQGLKPQLADFGLVLKRVRRTFQDGDQEVEVLDYFSLSSDRMMLDRRTVAVALQAFEKESAEPVLTYLANEIRKIPDPNIPSASNEEPSGGIPYSTVAALDPIVGGPLVDAAGKLLPPLKDDEIAVNAWAANDQKLKLGDRVRVTYFNPESTHGKEEEASADFRVAAILPFAEPETGFTRRKPAVFTVRPTTANDPDLTPEVKGITDQESISDWDAPFPFEYGRIRPQDDTYWENHRTTPKAFVSLATGKKLWGSRFGEVTSVRVAFREGLSEAALGGQFLAQLQATGETLGFEFIPIKKRDLDSSGGTTPFDVLFLLLSMFVIGAALLLVWLLFRLNVDQRAEQIGLLQALGWSSPSVGRLLFWEGLLVALVGAGVGTIMGCGYCWLMLAGLRTIWVGAISAPFLQFHARSISLGGGFLAGVLASGATIYWSLRGLKRLSICSLLAGKTEPEAALLTAHRRASNWTISVFWGLFAAALGLGALATQLQGEAQAGAFLGCGASVLTGLLLVLSRMLRREGGLARSQPLAGGLRELSWLNIGRNPSRSVATVALTASACFLVAAVSAFRLDPTDRGVAGFDLVAESSEPIFVDLNDPAARKEILGVEADALEGGEVYALRLKGGDDASCRNLYQATQPRVLGVTPALINHFSDAKALPFAWAGSAAKTTEETANPWRLLERPTPANAPIPVMLDKNTAMYSLRLYGGVGQEFEFDYEDAGVVKFRVAGLLANSVLQGGLYIGEADFRRIFPQVSGYRSFLIRAPAGKAAEISQLLEEKFGDEGLDCVDARSRLRDLLAVQNTYISTFQTLGGLGLALGTFGLTAVQLRSVMERRKEFALLRAIGFSGGRLSRMVLLENLWLLVGGLACGTVSAAVAVAPHMAIGGAGAPIWELAGMLGVIAGLGMVIGFIAVRSAVAAPVVSALRGD
jgi:putative ABC transport system permease protein